MRLIKLREQIAIFNIKFEYMDGFLEKGKKYEN